MSAAYLQLWARNSTIARAQVENGAMEESHSGENFSYAPDAACDSGRRIPGVRCRPPKRAAWRLCSGLWPDVASSARKGPGPDSPDHGGVVDRALDKAAINAALRPKVSKRVRGWMEKVWSIVRLPVSEGLVCYGAGENNEVSFIRVDHWLPDLKAKAVCSPTKAQSTLFQNIWAPYGPATLSDFSHWSGIPMQEVRALGPLVESQMVEVPGGNKSCFLLGERCCKLESRLWK